MCCYALSPQLFVKNIPITMGEKGVYDLFSPYGRVEGVVLHPHRRNVCYLVSEYMMNTQLVLIHSSGFFFSGQPELPTITASPVTVLTELGGGGGGMKTYDFLFFFFLGEHQNNFTHGINYKHSMYKNLGHMQYQNITSVASGGHINIILLRF